MGDWRVWLKGLLAAAIGGTATTALTFATDSAHADLDHIWRRAVIGGAVALAGYLAKSPLPDGEAKR